MNEEKSHNILNKLDALNKRVKRVEDEEIQEVPFDSSKFNSYSSAPINVPREVINQLADLFDGNTHFQEDEEEKQIGPNTVDKIMQSIAVVYIVEDGIPVAGATLFDPTIQTYKGIIPKDYYELKSGISLNGRVQQEFFEVHPDRHNIGLAGELKRMLEELAKSMFIIVADNDKDTQRGLLKNGYTPVAKFETDWENVPVQLWLN